MPTYSKPDKEPSMTKMLKYIRAYNKSIKPLSITGYSGMRKAGIQRIFNTYFEKKEMKLKNTNKVGRVYDLKKQYEIKVKSGRPGGRGVVNYPSIHTVNISD